MMKRDLIVFEHERFELTGYDVWMTVGEIAGLFGVTIMKVRGIINMSSRTTSTQGCRASSAIGFPTE